MKERSSLVDLVMAGFILIVLIISSSLTYQDEVAEAEHYQDMVCNGHWPDFKDVEPEC